MENFFKKQLETGILASIVLLIIGVLLILFTRNIINTVSYLIEITLITYGIITIINYVRIDVKNDTFSFGFIKGIVCIIIAIFLVVNPEIIVTILPIMLGIWMLFGSLTNLQAIIKLSSWGQKVSIVHIFVVILMFTLGIVCIFNPFKIGEAIIQVLGGIVVIYSLMDIIELISSLSLLKKCKNN